jgi:hypothetical protein
MFDVSGRMQCFFFRSKFQELSDFSKWKNYIRRANIIIIRFFAICDNVVVCKIYVNVFLLLISRCLKLDNW